MLSCVYCGINLSTGLVLPWGGGDGDCILRGEWSSQDRSLGHTQSSASIICTMKLTASTLSALSVLASDSCVKLRSACAFLSFVCDPCVSFGLGQWHCTEVCLCLCELWL